MSLFVFLHHRCACEKNRYVLINFVKGASPLIGVVGKCDDCNSEKNCKILKLLKAEPQLASII